MATQLKLTRQHQNCGNIFRDPQRTLDPSKQSVDDKPSAPGPSIAVPEQAHTTSVPSSFVKTQTSIDEDQLSIPEQQSPRTSTPQTLIRKGGWRLIWICYISP